ncbi:MAG TPA: hypothetical protein VNX88_03955 [Terriglobales bacterium]|nr:hypothetical protein [Terriglobales bacterium]
MSDQTGDGDSLPYAFVTYKILKVVRGRVLGETLTIRALGGLDHSDRLLFVDHMPFFGIGDEDILLVRGNGQRVCPFVNCSFGRFRIANDRVYNGFAVPITVCKNGSLKLGNGVNASLLSATIPREVPSFDTMLKTPFAQKRIREMGAISLDALRERYNREAPKEITVTYGGEENSKSGPRQTEHSVLPEECGPVLTNEFLTMLHTEAARLPPSGLMESRRRLL